ncbi:MAG: ribosomal L7Ae/L30e/S12e/Gadd45 family protein [Oscillospiraceae bacterium]|nr:ribosomal L7Ae/L30e/S12e/Gadd45 family protein [Oscillospiraceae bacterium]
MDRALNYLSLARKAGKLELGEEPVGSAARAQHARLVMVAQDASDHTWRRAKSFVAGTNQLCIRVPYSKAEMGAAVGRQELAIAAMTDPAMGVALIKALPQPEKYAEALEELSHRAERIQRHRKEEKAHQRNLRSKKK